MRSRTSSCAPIPPRKLPPDLARDMAALVLARTAAAAKNAMRRLGCADDVLADVSRWDVNTSALYKALRRYVLVICGPTATSFWRIDGAVANQASKYTTAVCAFCLDAGLHCTCEHIHVAFVHTEAMGMTAAQLPRRNQQFRQVAAASQLSPAEKRPAILSPPGAGSQTKLFRICRSDCIPFGIRFEETACSFGMGCAGKRVPQAGDHFGVACAGRIARLAHFVS